MRGLSRFGGMGVCWCRRFAGFLAIVGFVATGPGLSGVELVAHFSGAVDPAHARQVHVEAAGSTAHADHCQLGLTCGDGRLAPVAQEPLRHRLIAWRQASEPKTSPAEQDSAGQTLSRAPPTVRAS
jgi:hypothetical protein